MAAPTSYCEYVEHLPMDNIHRIYHDSGYGFPLDNDNELFGRLVLEINQAGLNWTIILNKQHNFKVAFDNFDIPTVAAYTDVDIARLLSNAGIIRNKAKINAAINNAKRIIELQKEHGSFKNWLDKNHPKTIDEWTKLFKKTFSFTGFEIVNEFLTSVGYFKGTHIESCWVYQKVIASNPAWLTT